MPDLRPIYRDGDRRSVSISFANATKRTKQSFADECDINNIMGEWARTGETHHVNKNAPIWGDFSNVSDYQTAANQIIEAQSQFDSMSAETRKHFDNDPAKLLGFMEGLDPDDADNLELAYKLQLLDRPAKPIINPEPSNEPGPDPKGATASEGETPSP